MHGDMTAAIRRNSSLKQGRNRRGLAAVYASMSIVLSRLSHAFAKCETPSYNSTSASERCLVQPANAATHFPRVSERQLVKNPRPVELHSADRPPKGMNPREWHARLELSVLARALYLYGMGSDLAAQCVMHRIDNDTMLMNEWGFFFEETTATSLVKVRFGEGTPAQGVHVRRDGSEAVAAPDVVNIGCVPVGRAIFRARPDVHAVVHAHPHAVMAVSATKKGLLPLSQAAFFLHGSIGRYKYEFGYNGDFESEIASRFAPRTRALVLDHHGVYAAGASAADAWFVTFYLNQACEVQLRAQATGEPLLLPPERELVAQNAEMLSSSDYAYDGSREWAGTVRKVNRELPGYEA